MARGKKELVAWGEQWLHDWCNEPGISTDERSNRMWIAENWREATLASAVQGWHEERRLFNGKSADEFNAQNAALDDLTLYVRERNGLLVWRAYREFRNAGLPIPEQILKIFDTWAGQLEQASGRAEIAAAIQMTGKKGGAQGARRLKDVIHRRSIASDVHRLIIFYGRRTMPADRAIAKIAEERSMEVSHVHSIYYAWIRPSKAATRSAGTATLSSVMKRFGK